MDVAVIATVLATLIIGPDQTLKSFIYHVIGSVTE